jgi:hypothetical protein
MNKKHPIFKEEFMNSLWVERIISKLIASMASLPEGVQFLEKIQELSSQWFMLRIAESVTNQTSYFDSYIKSVVAVFIMKHYEKF